VRLKIFVVYRTTTLLPGHLTHSFCSQQNAAVRIRYHSPHSIRIKCGRNLEGRVALRATWLCELVSVRVIGRCGASSFISTQFRQ
jgi:hypothetical protein